MDTETGEFGERRLEHGEREAEKFYRDLQQTGISVRVGMEAGKGRALPGCFVDAVREGASR